MKMIEYASADKLMDGITAAVVADLKNALGKNGAARLAVPGGSTPGPMFDRLSQTPIDWQNVTVMLGDERWVELDSPRSNTGLLKARLLVNSAAGAQYLPLYNGAATAQQGAPAVAQIVEDHLPLDVLILGMGADMHTASLFPGAAELSMAQHDDALAVVAITPGGELEQRVSLSARALDTARDVHLLIKGDDKKQALRKAQDLPPSQAPVSQFLDRATVHWTA